MDRSDEGPRLDATEDVRVEVLIGLAELLASDASHDARMTALCAWGARLIDCDRVSIFLRSGKGLIGAYNFGNPQDIAARFHRFRVSFRDPLVARAFETGRQVVVNDARNDPMFNANTARAARIEAIVLAPLWDPVSSPLGFVTAEYNERRQTFTDPQARMLAGVAAIAQSIVRSHAVVEAHTEVIVASEGMQERLQDLQRSESLGRLAGSVAHDFNNILAVIMGNAELLRDPGAQFDVKLVDDILAAADHAQALTRQLLQFARDRARVVAVFDVADVVQDLSRLLDRSLGDRSRLVLELETGCHVRMERTRLEQVLVNLAVNAREAMTDGGCLTISTRIAELDEAAAAPFDIGTGRYVVVTVTDDGQGIPEEILEHIFTPFVSGRSGDHNSGLGLATVFSAMTAAGGSVAAHNSDSGAVFELVLPLVQPKDRIAPTYEDPETALPRARKDEKVLVVDDNQPLLRIIARQLAALGYEVTTAASGDEALLMTSGAREFDLILSDVIMPGVLGIDLLRRWRETRPEQRFVFMTAYEGNPVAASRLDEEIPLLAKPFSTLQLARFVREALDH